MKIRYFRDQEKNPRAKGEEELQVLAEFLETDIQDSATGEEMLRKLERGVQGKEKTEITGNAHSLTIDHDKITMENLFDNATCVLPLPGAVLLQCVKSWLEFLDNDSVLGMVPPLAGD